MAVIETLGKYEIRRSLGRGSAGVVLEGWDPVIQRRVAIKTVRIEDASDPDTQEVLDRFRREAQAAGRLIHPNIVTIHDYGEAEGLAYIVMEYVEGPSLRTLVEGGQRLKVAEAVHVLLDVLEGLAFSHRHGVVHRDIKPGNVMLTGPVVAEARAKLADFGIARIESSTLTQAGTLMGTPAYMAPEQFLGEAIDARTDVYAAGVLLYQMLTGRRPFEGSISAIMHQVLTTEPRPPSLIEPLVGPELEAVVLQAIAKRPFQRFASAEAFAAALRAIDPDTPAEDPAGATIMGSPQGQPPAERAESRAEDAVMPPRSRLRLRVLIPGLGAIVALGVAATLLLPRTDADRPGRFSDPPRGGMTQNGLPAPSPDSGGTVRGQGAGGSPPAAATPARPPPGGDGAVVLPGPPATSPAPDVITPAVPAPPPAEVERAETHPPAVPPETPSIPPPVVEAPGPRVPDPPVVAPPSDTAPVAPAADLLPRLGDLIDRLVGELRCTLLTGRIDGARVSLSGIAPATAEKVLRRALADRALAVTLDWRAMDAGAAFCPVLDMLRPIGAGVGPGRPELTLADDRFVLRDGERLRPRIGMPASGGYLVVDYLSQDGTVLHLYPQVGDPQRGVAADPIRPYAPGARIALGDPRPGKPEWTVAEPYGRDVIIAVVTDEPLFAAPRPASGEMTADYLAALGEAISALRRRGGRITAAAVVVEVTPGS